MKMHTAWVLIRLMLSLSMTSPNQLREHEKPAIQGLEWRQERKNTAFFRSLSLEKNRQHISRFVQPRIGFNVILILELYSQQIPHIEYWLFIGLHRQTLQVMDTIQVIDRSITLSTHWLLAKWPLIGLIGKITHNFYNKIIAVFIFTNNPRLFRCDKPSTNLKRAPPPLNGKWNYEYLDNEKRQYKLSKLL